MKRFADLFTVLDQNTKTTAKVEPCNIMPIVAQGFCQLCDFQKCEAIWL